MNTITLSAGSPKRIGFISTRFAGTDGVTLEARKWAQILTGVGHSCFWMGGVLDTPEDTSLRVPLAYFNHPEVADLQTKLNASPIALLVTLFSIMTGNVWRTFSSHLLSSPLAVCRSRSTVLVAESTGDV